MLNGKLKDAFTNSSKRRTLTLSEVYDNPYLFKAYSVLKDMTVRVQKLGDSTGAYYSINDKAITINQTYLKNGKFSEAHSSLIHEIQHAIQHLEGFDNGTTPEGVDEYRKWNRRISRLINAHGVLYAYFLTDAYNAIIRGDNDKVEDIIAKMPQKVKDTWDEILEARQHLHEGFEIYRRTTGEVEGRNAQARAGMSEQERRSKPLTATEDYKRSEQIRSPSRNKRSSFITPEQIERFEQLMYHGTPNIILGNKFDLRYLGTGEGTQVEGYGIYLAQNPKVSDTYGKEYNGIVFELENGRPLTEEDLINEFTYASYDLMSVIKVGDIAPYPLYRQNHPRH